MLRISVHNEPRGVMFLLEGKLAGSWVQELEDCWRSVRSVVPTPNQRFNLTEVTFIDAAGKAFLAARHDEGAKLLAAGCLMNAMVSEISGTAISKRGCRRSDGECSATN